MDEATFAGQIKDALSHFYAPAHLQTHPLAELIAKDSGAGSTGGTRLRQILADAVEHLKPDASIPYGRPEWLSYRLMQMSYLESREIADVCLELGLARSTFYRYHREALDAVTSILWDEYQRRLAETSPEPSHSREGDQKTGLAEDEAVRVAQAAESQWANLELVLENALRTSEPLAQQEGVTLRVEAPSTLPAVYGDPAMLGQIVVTILSESIVRASQNSLLLEIVAEDAHTLWRVHELDRAKAASSIATRVALSESLLRVYGGRLWIETDGQGVALCFTLPTRPLKAILIVDDDADAIRLYQRYLSDQPFLLLMASSAEQVQDHLNRRIPDLVLLDVLMPKTDGWCILRSLKEAPATAQIPVVICSILAQPRLALALGATAVLHKPIDRETLLEEIQPLMSSQPSHPASPADSAYPPPT
ncbi:MAG: ATP-binding response regulator [Anaerolineae bacterium]